jgi:hypothetical protein
MKYIQLLFTTSTLIRLKARWGEIISPFGVSVSSPDWGENLKCQPSIRNLTTQKSELVELFLSTGRLFRLVCSKE